jgi:hypothetical protein
MRKTENWSWAPDGGLIPGQTGRLIFGHNFDVDFDDRAINPIQESSTSQSCVAIYDVQRIRVAARRGRVARWRPIWLQTRLTISI